MAAFRESGILEVEAFGPLRGSWPAGVPWGGGSRERLLEALLAAAPTARALLPHSLVLVDGQRLGPQDDVPAGARIQVLPPVSGG